MARTFIKFSTRKFSYQDRLWVGEHYCFNSRILASKAKQFKLSVKATAFSIPLAHLTVHRHKSLLAINDDI